MSRPVPVSNPGETRQRIPLADAPLSVADTIVQKPVRFFTSSRPEGQTERRNQLVDAVMTDAHPLTIQKTTPAKKQRDINRPPADYVDERYKRLKPVSDTELKASIFDEKAASEEPSKGKRLLRWLAKPFKTKR
jgi:hypothetical protein